MGLTKRRDSYYVEFPVIDNGETITLARKGGGRLKRWKVGSLNRTLARQQEALIKTRLMSNQEVSPVATRAQAMTFRQWGDLYLGLEEVKNLKSYDQRKLYVTNLVHFFGDKPLNAITADDVRRYQEQRRGPKGRPVSVQTVNHDHMTLIRMLNVARSPQFGLLSDNVAANVPKPNPQNERDRIATIEEWARLQQAAAQHLRAILTILHDVGPRRGELLKLEWFRRRHAAEGVYTPTYQ